MSLSHIMVIFFYLQTQVVYLLEMDVSLKSSLVTGNTKYKQTPFKDRTLAGYCLKQFIPEQFFVLSALQTQTWLWLKGHGDNLGPIFFPTNIIFICLQCFSDKPKLVCQSQSYRQDVFVNINSLYRKKYILFTLVFSISYNM